MSDEELAPARDAYLKARAAYLAARADVWAAGRATLADAIAAKDAALDRYRSAGAAYTAACEASAQSPGNEKAPP